MKIERIEQILAFLKSAEALKDTLRSAHTSSGRKESTAEHTWRLSLMAMLMAREFPGLDQLKLLKLCIVHDLAEAITGDIPAIEQTGTDKTIFSKTKAEAAAMDELTAALPEDLRAEVTSLWQEYEAAETHEAVLAKGLDKLETILQHNQGANPSDFDYEFNLGYGRKQTERLPLLAQLREILDDETRMRMNAARGEEEQQKS